MFGWFHRRWVSRVEYDIMKEAYEMRISGLEKLVVSMEELAVAQMKDEASKLELTQALAEMVGMNIKPGKLH